MSALPLQPALKVGVRAVGLLAVLLLVAAGGCWHPIEARCADCAVAAVARPWPAHAQVGTEVLLVPGAFGFGPEWGPTVEALRARPDLAFCVWRWSGPWSGLEVRARELLGFLQREVGRLPPGSTLVVIGHSAGAVIADYAVRALAVPAGRSVRVVAVAPPWYLKLHPYAVEDTVNTPLGFPVGYEYRTAPPLPPGVEEVEYVEGDEALDRGDLVVRVPLGRRVGHRRALRLVGPVALPPGPAPLAARPSR